MKKWYRYLAAGVLVLLTLCVAGCGGVSHKSPEKVTEELIQSYTDGKEKKVKECYNQADNTEADVPASRPESALPAVFPPCFCALHRNGNSDTALPLPAFSAPPCFLW